MNKFKAGDTVVCKDASGFDMGHLEVGRSYKVEFCDGVNIELVGVDYSTKVWRFEPFKEWASQQKRVSAKDELVMAKLQIASLQELKRSQAALLKELCQGIVALDTSSCCELGCGGYCYQHADDCVVKKAQEYLKENE